MTRTCGYKYYFTLDFMLESFQFLVTRKPHIRSIISARSVQRHSQHGPIGHYINIDLDEKFFALHSV